MRRSGDLVGFGAGCVSRCLFTTLDITWTTLEISIINIFSNIQALKMLDASAKVLYDDDDDDDDDDEVSQYKEGVLEANVRLTYLLTQ